MADKIGGGSLYSRFEDLGYEVTRIREQVLSRLPTSEEASALGIPVGVPCWISPDQPGRGFR
jgi:DNA-binding GntR family transcriptional regulator